MPLNFRITLSAITVVVIVALVPAQGGGQTRTLNSPATCDPWASRRTSASLPDKTEFRCPAAYEVERLPEVGPVCRLALSPSCGNFSRTAIVRLPNDAVMVSEDNVTDTVVVCRTFNQSVPCGDEVSSGRTSDYLQYEEQLLHWPGVDNGSTTAATVGVLQLLLAFNESHGVVLCAADTVTPKVKDDYYATATSTKATTTKSLEALMENQTSVGKMTQTDSFSQRESRVAESSNKTKPGDDKSTKRATEHRNPRTANKGKRNKKSTITSTSNPTLASAKQKSEHSSSKSEGQKLESKVDNFATAKPKHDSKNSKTVSATPTTTSQAPQPQRTDPHAAAHFLPDMCIPYRIPADGCEHPTSIPYHDRTIGGAGAGERGATVDVCQPVSSRFLKCDSHHRYGADKFGQADQLAVRVNLGRNHGGQRLFEFGDYLMDEKGTSVFICMDTSGAEAKISNTGGAGKLTGSYLGASASAISAIFLSLAAAAFFLCPEVHRQARSTLLPLCVSMLAMHVANVAHHLVLLTGESGEEEWRASLIFAARYTFALAAFFWLNVLAFDLWLVFAGTGMNRPMANGGRLSHTSSWPVVARCAYAWGIPAVLCAVALGVSHSAEAQRSVRLELAIGQAGASWFRTDEGAYVFFYTPITVLLLENAIFFALTVRALRRAVAGAGDAGCRNRTRNLFRVFVKLFLVMGLCWTSEVLSMLLRHSTEPSVWYAFDAFNLLQGVWLFLVYFGKRETLVTVAGKLMGKGGGRGGQSESRGPRDYTITAANIST